MHFNRKITKTKSGIEQVTIEPKALVKFLLSEVENTHQQLERTRKRSTCNVPTFFVDGKYLK